MNEYSSQLAVVNNKHSIIVCVCVGGGGGGGIKVSSLVSLQNGDAVCVCVCVCGGGVIKVSSLVSLQNGDAVCECIRVCVAAYILKIFLMCSDVANTLHSNPLVITLSRIHLQKKQYNILHWYR